MAVGWRRILVPIQFSKRLPDAELKLARDLARIHDAKILLLHVVPLNPTITADAGLSAHYFVEAEKDAKLKLRKLAQSRLKGLDFEIFVISGDPASTIEKEAANLKADLVVIATHGRTALKRILLGSVAEHVVSHCPCALLTIRPGE